MYPERRWNKGRFKQHGACSFNKIGPVNENCVVLFNIIYVNSCLLFKHQRATPNTNDKLGYSHFLSLNSITG